LVGTINVERLGVLLPELYEQHNFLRGQKVKVSQPATAYRIDSGEKYIEDEDSLAF